MYTHIHIDTLCGVTGRHIFGVSQQGGIPGQQRRDNVSALLVNSLFYPVSGPQSVKGVCLWHTHTPHMHIMHTHTHHLHRPLCLSQPVRRQRLKKPQVTKDAHRHGCQHRQKLRYCVDAFCNFYLMTHGFWNQEVCPTDCVSLTDRM